MKPFALFFAIALAAGPSRAQDPTTSLDAAGEPRETAAMPRGEQAASQAPVVPPVPFTEAGPQLLTEQLREGVGEEAHSGMRIAVHYTGWLHEPAALGYRGKKFDSSRDRGQPFVFDLGAGRVLKGWEIGIVGMRVGELRRLVVPPELAYGSRGFGNGLIPPNATLVFEVELLGVESNEFVRNAK